MTTLLSLELVYVLAGIVLLVFSLLTFADRSNPNRVASGLFWLILAVIFALGGTLPHWLTGVMVLLMVALDGLGRVRRGHPANDDAASPQRYARRLGNRIFIPVFAVPMTTFAIAIVCRWLNYDPGRGALIGLAAGGCLAMVLILKLTGGSIREMFEAGNRLNETMGTVNILPQLLASLGVIFTAAKVGDIIAAGIQHVVPADSLFLLVVANCLGMTLFTIVMGNSFAAFPVISTGVLVPLIVKPFGADPAMAAILTLTAGSSGTLMTPMAANFNIVPAALLELRNTYGVIRFQLPFALAIWICHVLLMWAFIRVLA